MHFPLDTFAALVHNLVMATKAKTVTIRVTAKLHKELEALAIAQRRSLSNLGEYFLSLGKLKYYEEDVLAARERQSKEQAV